MAKSNLDPNRFDRMFGRRTGPHGLSHLALSNLVVWGDHLSVEHPELDAQHEAIFRLASKLHESWRTCASACELKPVVARMQNLLARHFRYEETVFDEARIPMPDEHRAEHRTILKQFQAIHERLEVQPSSAIPQAGWSVFDHLLGATVGHIVSSDIDYAKLLRDRPMPPDCPS